MFWLLSFDGQPAGLVAYDLHPGNEVEIETFGLIPEFTGRRLGGYALTLGIQRAWDLTPRVGRIWLHTSSVDHPNALPNHHRRGFRASGPKKANVPDRVGWLQQTASGWSKRQLHGAPGNPVNRMLMK
jgi:hypothetical protein